MVTDGRGVSRRQALGTSAHKKAKSPTAAEAMGLKRKVLPELILAACIQNAEHNAFSRRSPSPPTTPPGSESAYRRPQYRRSGPATLTDRANKHTNRNPGLN